MKDPFHSFFYFSSCGVRSFLFQKQQNHFFAIRKQQNHCLIFIEKAGSKGLKQLDMTLLISGQFYPKLHKASDIELNNKTNAKKH
jgi:hypothetical protein